MSKIKVCAIHFLRIKLKLLYRKNLKKKKLEGTLVPFLICDWCDS